MQSKAMIAGSLVKFKILVEATMMLAEITVRSHPLHCQMI
jgi:hypothetical protein